MARVLLTGVDPDLTDFTDPALPPGLDAGRIRAGIEASLSALRAAGHDAHHQSIPPDPRDLGALARRLDEGFDCLVVGGGVRLPPANLPLFEAVLNLAARRSPAPAIALTARPTDAPDAVARVLALLPDLP